MKNNIAAYVNELRISMTRFRAVLKIPSMLVIYSILFVSVSTETLMDLISETRDRVVLILILGILIVLRFKKWEIPFRKEASSFGQVDNAKLAHRKGLVITVGLDSANSGSAVAKLLTKARGVESIALIGTPEVVKQGVFEKIVDQLIPAAGLSIDEENIRIWDKVDSLKISDAHRSTSEALDWMFQLGYGPQELVVDISEGRKATTIGAEKAADAILVEVQYLAVDENRPGDGKQVFKVVSEEY